MKIFFIGICFLLFCGTAKSAEYWGNSKIKSVYSLQNGDFILFLETNIPQCTAADQRFHVINGSVGVNASGVKALNAAALTAFALNKTINFAFEDVSGTCYISRFAIIN